MKLIGSNNSNEITATATAEIEEIIDLFLRSTDVKPSSRATYARQLRSFTQWLSASGKTSSLTTADLLEYKQHLLDSGKSVLTTAGYITTLRLLCGWLSAKTGTADISKGVKLPHRRQTFVKQHLTADQARALEAAVTTPRDIAIVTLMLHTGLRCIEVVRANVEDLTYRGGRRVLMVQGKGHDAKDDFVIISPKVGEALDAYLDSRNAKKGEPLFASESHRNNGGRLTTTMIGLIVKRALRAIGLRGHEYSAHSLRHTTAVAILTKTNDLTAAQEVLRHSNIATTQIYTESIKEQRRLERAAELQLDEIF